ncbi:hypothetical protein DAERI_070045 [Deinococcus aerius]|uniref:Uncharacterized protein n=1 Tax=Deinococcus aerius TaxID=200253 RepID=A0A2I9DTR5_9DEIO|nr:hypothetical protein [Deinococcus aerius]GBF06047.1 hypothetical protein DAERI_070045 [Deinococcus aerius]
MQPPGAHHHVLLQVVARVEELLDRNLPRAGTSQPKRRWRTAGGIPTWRANSASQRAWSPVRGGPRNTYTGRFQGLAANGQPLGGGQVRLTREPLPVRQR